MTTEYSEQRAIPTNLFRAGHQMITNVDTIEQIENGFNGKRKIRLNQ